MGKNKELAAKYIAWAMPLIVADVPFRPKGRDAAGLDCWGVVWLGKKAVEGIELPSYTEEYEHGDIRRGQENLGRIFSREVPLWAKVPAGQDRPGDVVLMRLNGRSIHVGLVITPSIMLHIEENINLCIEDYNGTTWKHRVTGVYRYSS